MEVTNLANAQNVGIIISPNLQKLKVWRKKGTKGYFMVFHTYKYQNKMTSFRIMHDNATLSVFRSLQGLNMRLE